MKLEFFHQSFQKYSNVKFHEKPYSVNRAVACGQKYRRIDTNDEANSRFFKLSNSA